MYLRVSLLEHLDLRDAVLVGHSMGTGEVTRHLASNGSGDHHALQLGHHRPRVAKAVLIAPIPPDLPQTPDNPDGAPQALFDGFAAAARADTVRLYLGEQVVLQVFAPSLRRRAGGQTDRTEDQVRSWF